MSSIKLAPNASGTGEFTIAAPNSNTNRTLTLPDQTGTVLTGSGPISVNASAPISAMTLDANGQLGIGNTTPGYRLDVTAGDTTVGFGYALRLRSNATAGAATLQFTNNGVTVENGYIRVTDAGLMSFSNKAYIDSSGNLLVGTTSVPSPSGVAGSGLVVSNSSNNGGWAVFQSTGSSSNRGIAVSYTGAAPNDGFNEAYFFRDSSATRFIVKSNGGINNYSANNVNLSDRREKTNFAPAGEYLSKICAIPVQTFNYIDQNMEDDPGLTLGVVAQDVQTVAPELVAEANWGTEEEPKMRLSIYQTDLQYALMKCIQEQQAIIEQLTTRIAALEAK